MFATFHVHLSARAAILPVGYGFLTKPSNSAVAANSPAASGDQISFITTSSPSGPWCAMDAVSFELNLSTDRDAFQHLGSGKHHDPSTIVMDSMSRLFDGPVLYPQTDLSSGAA
jgi:hypothetical protein